MCSSSRSIISIPFLWVAILNFWLPLASHNIENSFFESLELENMGRPQPLKLCNYLVYNPNYTCFRFCSRELSFASAILNSLVKIYIFVNVSMSEMYKSTRIADASLYLPQFSCFQRRKRGVGHPNLGNALPCGHTLFFSKIFRHRFNVWDNGCPLNFSNDISRKWIVAKIYTFDRPGVFLCPVSGGSNYYIY